MPPKTVTCVLCGKTVLKAHTYAWDGGQRACREHPMAQARAVAEEKNDKERRVQEVAASQAALDAKMRKAFRPDFTARMEQGLKDAAEFRERMYTHCWTCSQEGITLREYFAQCLITQKRLELRGEWNFLTLPHDMAELMGHPRVLACIPYDEQKDRTIYRAITNRSTKDILPLLRFVNMCVECIDKHKVRDRFEALLPKPTWEQLEAIMPAVVAIDPLLEVMAEKKEQEN